MERVFLPIRWKSERINEPIDIKRRIKYIADSIRWGDSMLVSERGLGSNWTIAKKLD
jgi:hypothetical protein